MSARVALRRGDLELDVDLDIGSGSTLALLGPNGAGKSTLLKAMAGLIWPSDTKVTHGDAVWSDPSRGAFTPVRERGIGFVFQDRALFPAADVLDNVAYGAPDPRRADARSRATSLLEDLGFAHLIDRDVRSLSGGEAQGVALARALCSRPRVLFLDEPLAALDVDRRGAARRKLRDVLDNFDGVKIIVTHDPIEAASLSDEVAIIEAGRIVQRGTFEEIAARPRCSFSAALAGVNLITGTIHRDGDRVRVESALGELVVVSDLPDRTPVLASVHPHAIGLSLERPSGSARNVLDCRVVSLDRWGGRVRVRLGSSPPLTAEVTLEAARELGLAPEMSLFATIKATEIAVHPA